MKVTCLKVFLDDIRDPIDNSWIIARTAEEALNLIETGFVTEISLDHDLGETTQTGYYVAKKIEELAFYNKIPRLVWHIHSANTVGVANIQAALNKADEYWTNANITKEEK